MALDLLNSGNLEQLALEGLMFILSLGNTLGQIKIRGVFRGGETGARPQLNKRMPIPTRRR